MESENQQAEPKPEHGESVVNFDLPLEEVPGYEQMKVAAEEYLPIETAYDWMFEIFFILLITALLSLMASLLLRGIMHVMSRTRHKWDDIFVKAARTPLKAIIWILGIYYAASVIYDPDESEFIHSLSNVRDVGIVLMIAWALNRFITLGQQRFIRKRIERGMNYDYTAINAVGKLLKIAVNVSTLLIALQNLGIGIDGVLAFGGLSGVAFGFAAKDMLANFMGGFAIYFDKPFKVGDWIRSPDKEIEGTVEDIGWRVTTLLTFDKRPLYVPNSVLSNISVENPSRMTNRRIKTYVGIRYDDIKLMRPIVDAIRDMINKHPDIDTSMTIIVHFEIFNASSCDILIYCFCKTVDWVEYHRIREDVLLKVVDIIDAHGAKVALPTQILRMIEENDAEHCQSMPA